jgi:hypothetical protein
MAHIGSHRVHGRLILRQTRRIASHTSIPESLQLLNAESEYRMPPNIECLRIIHRLRTKARILQWMTLPVLCRFQIARASRAESPFGLLSR